MTIGEDWSKYAVGGRRLGVAFRRKGRTIVDMLALAVLPLPPTIVASYPGHAAVYLLVVPAYGLCLLAALDLAPGFGVSSWRTRSVAGRVLTSLLVIWCVITALTVPLNSALRVRILVTQEAMDRDAESLLEDAKSHGLSTVSEGRQRSSLPEGQSLGSYQIVGRPTVRLEYGQWTVWANVFQGTLIYSPSGDPIVHGDIEHLVGKWYQTSVSFMSS
jgi:hypothetical protein